MLYNNAHRNKVSAIDGGLKRVEHNGMTVSDAEEASNLLETEHIDLIISDVIMPKMDGYQLASKVKEKYPDIKI